MTEIFVTAAGNTRPLLGKLLAERCGDTEILRDRYGKPYICGNALYFNVSHSGPMGMVALSPSPVGADAEYIRNVRHDRIYASYPADEREEIRDITDFFAHYTAREAYMKYLGRPIYPAIKTLKYIRGRIYANGLETDADISIYSCGDTVLSICGKDTDISFTDAGYGACFSPYAGNDGARGTGK